MGILVLPGYFAERFSISSLMGAELKGGKRKKDALAVGKRLQKCVFFFSDIKHGGKTLESCLKGDRCFSPA